MPQSGAKRAVIIRRGTVETPLRSFPGYNQRMERAVRTQGFIARQLRCFQIQRRAELLTADGQHIASCVTVMAASGIADINSLSFRMANCS